MSIRQDIGTQIASAGAKTAPAAAVSLTTLFGLPWPTIVQIATFAWICLQGFFLVRNEIRKRRGRS